MGKNKKTGGKGSKKIGRNKIKCSRYRAENRKEKNKAKKQRKVQKEAERKVAKKARKISE